MYVIKWSVRFGVRAFQSLVRILFCGSTQKDEVYIDGRNNLHGATTMTGVGRSLLDGRRKAIC